MDRVFDKFSKEGFGYWWFRLGQNPLLYVLLKFRMTFHFPRNLTFELRLALGRISYVECVRGSRTAQT
jgi:hypothetical protein